MTSLSHHVACPGCGCVCDDLTIELDGDRLVRFEPACQLGEQWFRQHRRDEDPVARCRGQAVELQEALNEAVQLIERADYPLIYGLSRSSTPGQRAAVALAEQLGGVVDTTASLCHGPSIMALQEMGEVTSTLGEIRNRADLVIFWGCHPAQSHPRHAERYSVTAPGRYLPGGRSDRQVVMIGAAGQVDRRRIDLAGSEPDLVVSVEPGRDFELLRELRGRLLPLGPEHDSTAVPQSAAADPAAVDRLFEMIRTCRYGVVFFGLGLAGESSWAESDASVAGYANVSALLDLVRELNAVTRFTARRMRLQGDVSGADNVLCWQTGYPFAVDFSRGYPRYNPGEFSAGELLARRDVDLCLLVGGETLPYFSPAALEHLRSIPVILLDYPGASSIVSPRVHFTTAVYGLHAAGTVYRMDNVPIPLKSLYQTDLPTDEHILQQLHQAIE